MKDLLAEQLLAKVMGWTPEDVARERPRLQAMATYKYDEYQQFSPGMRFIESLALWLSQFRSIDEKRIAYEFVMTKLIFCCTAELNHLISMTYPDYIRPMLLKRAAKEAGYDERHIAKVAESTQFKVHQRQCLFLGLSDGARVDVFRRYNQELSHEQIWQTYEIPTERVNNLLAKLKSALFALLGKEVPEDMQRFRTVVLFDDFSASGISYLRKEESGKFEGKIAKFYQCITNPENAVSRLVDIKDTQILILLYMATEHARQRVEEIAKELWSPLGAKCSVLVIYPLSSDVCLAPGNCGSIGTLLEAYYDPSIEDEHTQTGGVDLKFGFASCGLPLILSHNTPNNSLYLLWAKSEKVRPLFPRISRHKKEL